MFHTAFAVKFCCNKKCFWQNFAKTEPFHRYTVLQRTNSIGIFPTNFVVATFCNNEYLIATFCNKKQLLFWQSRDSIGRLSWYCRRERAGGGVASTQTR